MQFLLKFPTLRDIMHAIGSTINCASLLAGLGGSGEFESNFVEISGMIYENPDLEGFL